MINNSSFILIKRFSVIIIVAFLFSCKNEVTLNFSEKSIINEEEATIEINIPKAEGKTKAAKQINTTLTHFVNTALNVEGTFAAKVDTKESIADFKKAYKDFKTQIGKTLFTELPPWEVLIDGEVLYKTDALVSIVMSSSINTGGAHSNLIFRFYNFDSKTGRELQTKDLLNNVTAFTALAKKYYDKELLSIEDNTIAAFDANEFKLPKHLGFSEDGVIVFYDTFNTSTNNVIEFTIPYTLANDYLNF